MIIREFKKEDKVQVEIIFKMYWNDPVFQKELSAELDVSNNSITESDWSRFYVAEENKAIIGVAGFKSAPKYLKKFATTNNPIELYITAVKNKRQGIGEVLRTKRLNDAKKLGFTEALLYSPDTHKDSWAFHDTLGFVRVGTCTAPDGYPGMIWRKEL